jgi:hypothetical protein
MGGPLADPSIDDDDDASAIAADFSDPVIAQPYDGQFIVTHVVSVSAIPELADAGLADWAAGLPAGDESLVDVSTGKPVRWVAGQGWTEAPA